MITIAGGIILAVLFFAMLPFLISLLPYFLWAAASIFVGVLVMLLLPMHPNGANNPPDLSMGTVTVTAIIVFFGGIMLWRNFLKEFD
jgi:hypothetical protein